MTIALSITGILILIAALLFFIAPVLAVGFCIYQVARLFVEAIQAVDDQRDQLR